MPLFPMFLDLSQATVLVVGDGAEAQRKAELLKPFCACVLRRSYPPAVSEAPALVILAERNHPDNEALAAQFREMHIPVNVCDRPELCDFRFPSLITRGEISGGLSTGGGAPVLRGLLREQLEDALPENLDEIARAAAALTARLRAEVPDQKERARLLREMIEQML